MSKRRLVLLVLLCALLGIDQVVAQDTVSHQWVYYNSLSMGSFIGNDEQPVTASITTTHGLEYGRFRMGIGVGYEGFASWKTMPVFISTSYDLLRLSQGAFFIQLNGGYAYAWRINRVEYVLREQETGGLMINPMVGYRLSISKFSFYLAVGNKIQRTIYSYDYLTWGGNSRIRYDQELNKFMVSLGFGLH